MLKVENQGEKYEDQYNIRKEMYLQKEKVAHEIKEGKDQEKILMSSKEKKWEKREFRNIY